MTEHTCTKNTETEILQLSLKQYIYEMDTIIQKSLVYKTTVGCIVFLANGIS